MNVSGTGSAGGTACSAGASGIGLEFVRPMGVPPYAPKADETSSAKQTTNDDDSTDAAASANQPNIYGGRLDLKA